jgi:hypothetical protein
VQLLCLPGKTTAFVGPQFIVSSVVALVQLHGVPAAAVVVQIVYVGWESSVAYSISFVFCPEPHTGAVQAASVKVIGSVTVVTTRPFFGSKLWLLLAVVGMVCFLASVGQLPPPPTQAQARSTVALPVTQKFVPPNPLTSTLTLNGLLHEKSKTFTACAQALPGRATPAPHASTVNKAKTFILRIMFPPNSNLNPRDGRALRLK